MDYQELDEITIDNNNYYLKDALNVLDIVEYKGQLYTVIENSYNYLVLKPLAKFKIEEEIEE